MKSAVRLVAEGSAEAVKQVGPMPSLAPLVNRIVSMTSYTVALAWIDYYTMPPVAELWGRDGADRSTAAGGPGDLVTSDFGYVRFLGNHREMDGLVARAVTEGRRRGEWGSLLVNRAPETRAWIPALRHLVERVPLVFVYYNNHYAGFAPGSIDLLKRLWLEDGTS